MFLFQGVQNTSIRGWVGVGERGKECNTLTEIKFLHNALYLNLHMSNV